MLHYKTEPKRVLIMDVDLETEGMDPQIWQSIMRQLLGRHYPDIQKNGPGWSVPRYALEKLEAFLVNSTTTSTTTIPSITTTPFTTTTPSTTTTTPSTTTVSSISTTIPSITTTTPSLPKKSIKFASSTIDIPITILSKKTTKLSTLTDLLPVKKPVSISITHGYKHDVSKDLLQFAASWLNSK